MRRLFENCSVLIGDFWHLTWACNKRWHLLRNASFVMGFCFVLHVIYTGGRYDVVCGISQNSQTIQWKFVLKCVFRQGTVDLLRGLQVHPCRFSAAGTDPGTLWAYCPEWQHHFPQVYTGRSLQTGLFLKNSGKTRRRSLETEIRRLPCNLSEPLW